MRHGRAKIAIIACTASFVATLIRAKFPGPAGRIDVDDLGAGRVAAASECALSNGVVGRPHDTAPNQSNNNSRRSQAASRNASPASAMSIGGCRSSFSMRVWRSPTAISIWAASPARARTHSIRAGLAVWTGTG